MRRLRILSALILATSIYGAGSWSRTVCGNLPGVRRIPVESCSIDRTHFSASRLPGKLQSAIAFYVEFRLVCLAAESN
jgi:hypothetical protein